MNMHEFAKRTACESGCTIEETEGVLKAAFTVLARALAAGEKLTVSNVGTFHVMQSPAQQAYNPQTGQMFPLGPRKRVKFRPTGRLVQMVRDGDVNASIRKLPKTPRP